MIKIQFPIQLAIAKTIHRSQGLSLNELVFYPNNVKKHGLTYIALSRIQTKEKLFLLTIFQHEIFYVDPKIHVEMNRLKTITIWIPLILQFKNLHNSHVIIQTLNTTSLHQHYEDINHDHNLQMSHILFLIETRIHHAITYVHKYINSSKYSYISIHDGHGLMMKYDTHMHLNSFNIISNDGSRYITTIFNTNTQKIYILYVYRAHSCSKFTFLNNLKTIIQQSPKHCPIIIMGDFNVDILKDNNQPKKKKTIIF
jgi:hypothetical protein